MIKFFETEQPLSIDEIRKVEKELNTQLPQEYTEHLLKFNGGRCEPNIFSFLENGKETQSRVNWFLAIYDGEYDNFVDFFKDYKRNEKRVPENVIPIANDPFGNLICIDSENSKIYFWNHDNEVDYSKENDSHRPNMYTISNSLSEFLSTLKNEI